MYELLLDPNVGARFVTLLLLKLNESGLLEGGLTVYQPGSTPEAGIICFEK